MPYSIIYFDRADFIYTGIAGKNEQIMSFRKGEIARYKSTDLDYPQKFAHFSHSWHRLNQSNRDIIFANQNYENPDLTQDRSNGFGRGFGY